MISSPCPKNRQARGVARLAAALLPLIFVGSIFAADCGQLPPSSVSIKRLESPATLNTRFSYQALRRLEDTPGRHEFAVLGLTRGQAVARILINGRTQVSSDGRWECASFDLTVEYGFNPLTIYVAREFPKGSCAHDEIYRHELMHLRAFTEHAQSIEAEISSTLRQRFERATPWHGQYGEVNASLQREIDERWLPYLKRLLDGVKPAQRQIDSPQEYARIAASCDGAIQRKLQRNTK